MTKMKKGNDNVLYTRENSTGRLLEFGLAKIGYIGLNLIFNE